MHAVHGTDGHQSGNIGPTLSKTDPIGPDNQANNHNGGQLSGFFIFCPRTTQPPMLHSMAPSKGTYVNWPKALIRKHNFMVYFTEYIYGCGANSVEKH